MYKLYFLIIILTLSPLNIANPMRPDPLNNSTNHTAQPTKAVKRQPTLARLVNIIIIDDYQIAQFGRKKVKVGDQISGYMISAIEPDYVIVKRSGKSKKIELKKTGSFSMIPADEE